MSSSISLLSIEDIQAALDRSSFARFLGLRVIAADQEARTLRVLMPARSDVVRSGANNHVHGGAIASLIDVAGDFAVAMLVGGAVPTINLHVDYLRPSSGDHVEAVAHIRKLGKSISVVDVEVTDSEARLVAIGRASYVSKFG